MGGGSGDYDDKGTVWKIGRPFIWGEFILLPGELVFIIPSTKELAVSSVVVIFGIFSNNSNNIIIYQRTWYGDLIFSLPSGF